MFFPQPVGAVGEKLVMHLYADLLRHSLYPIPSPNEVNKGMDKVLEKQKLLVVLSTVLGRAMGYVLLVLCDSLLLPRPGSVNPMWHAAL